MRSGLSSVFLNPQPSRVVFNLLQSTSSKMSQPFSASQQVEKKAEASTVTVAYKLFAYKTELARRKRRYKPHSEKKLELSLSLIFQNAEKDNEYQWNKYFRSSVDAAVYRQKVKFEVALYMAELQSRNKNMDRETVLQHCKVFYQTLTERSTRYIDPRSQPETPRLVQIRRKMSCYW